jgi:hypothetical protein
MMVGMGVFSTPWCGLQVRIIQADVTGIRWEYHGKLVLNFWNTISSHLFLGGQRIEATLEDRAFDGLSSICLVG